MEDWNTVVHYSFKCINNFKNNVGLENYLALLQRGLRKQIEELSAAVRLSGIKKNHIIDFLTL